MKSYFDLKIDRKFKGFLIKNHYQLSRYGGTWPTKNNEYPIEVGIFEPKEGGQLKNQGKYLRIYHSARQNFDKDNENANKFWNNIIRDREIYPIKELLKLAQEFIQGYK